MTVRLLKGFRDFYPEEMAFQSWFYKNLKEVSRSFGFQEYEGPTLETLDLYAAKSGEELVKKQAFTLPDKSGKTLALRPEMTPTLARMVAQNAGSLVFPVKWFTYGRRFRYEQPQKGRGREFFQWDIDILGPDSYLADAEMMVIATAFYKKLNLLPSEVKIKFNDRQFLQEKITAFGISQDLFTPLLKVIDKKSKVEPEVFLQMLRELGLSDQSIEKLMQLLADKNAYQDSDWLRGIADYVSKTGFGDYIEYDASIVRGLDYYTRTVFEGWDVNGQFRSIWGGGRYDNLTKDVGASEKIPGVGFAMGDMVMEEVLRANGKYPVLDANPTKILVTVFSPNLISQSLDLSINLRSQNLNVELYPDANAKLDKQLKYASRKGIPYVAILGPDEVAKNLITLKNLQTGQQQQTAPDQVINLIT